MFNDLLLHDDTKRRLEAFTGRPAHALLISGPAGAGKKHLARRLSAVLLDTGAEKLAGHPQFFVISKLSGKSEITIDSARQLINKFTLKVAGVPRPVNRVAIVEDADLLSLEAQNALLKLLEEPPASTLLILTSSRLQNILPTVLSRLQTLSVQPVTLGQSQAYFNNFPPAEVESAWRLSRGAPSFLSALLAQGQNHEMKQAVEEAKMLISMKKYERLGVIQAAAKDKEGFGRLLEALCRVLGVLQQTNASNRKSADKILKARKAVISAQESLDRNTNLRLLALDLALSIPL